MTRTLRSGNPVSTLTRVVGFAGVFAGTVSFFSSLLVDGSGDNEELAGITVIEALPWARGDVVALGTKMMERGIDTEVAPVISGVTERELVVPWTVNAAPHGIEFEELFVPFVLN